MTGLLPLFEAEMADPDHFELIEAVDELVSHIGWAFVQAEAMQILASSELLRFWHQAMCVVFWSSSSEVRIPPCGDAMDCVARLYLCLERDRRLDENLVWSIAHQLKGVSYLSAWNPLLDREVVMRMAAMRLTR